jgi:hypothetical protein
VEAVFLSQASSAFLITFINLGAFLFFGGGGRLG